MIRTELRLHRSLASACALLAMSCESTTQVGSDCRDGVCPRQNLVTSLACVVSSTVAEIAITRIANEDVKGALESICLPRPLPTDAQGLVACRLLWRIGEAEAPCEGEVPCYAEDDEGNPVPVAPHWTGQCSDLAFLEPAGGGEPANVCLVRQVTADEVAAGELDGWFYADIASVSVDRQCLNQGPGLSFTSGAYPPSGVVVDIDCSRVQTVEDGEFVDVAANECTPLPEADPSDLGAACLPAVTPEGGFADQEAYVEAGSEQCDSEACLVFRLRGDPGPDCTADPDSRLYCATESELEQRAYCSCRCDAPAADPGSLCECADGFTCVEVLRDGPPGIRGSYCVRDGAFTRTSN